MKSAWCMEEFLVAHREGVTKQKTYLIPVLMEDLDADELEKHPELKLYINTHTYIDAKKLNNENLADPVKEVNHIRKRIRWELVRSIRAKVKAVCRKSLQNMSTCRVPYCFPLVFCKVMIFQFLHLICI